MKWVIVFISFILMSFACFAQSADSVFLTFASKPVINKEDCSCNGKKLYGKVKVVNSYADFDVKIVNAFPDIKVKEVDVFPDACGKWKFVDSYPDFTVRFVDSYPDFEIKFVDVFPGIK